MLPPHHRLTSTDSFRSAVRRGRRAGSRTLVVHLETGTQPGPARVGFVVSKAVGNAVIRNRVKRQLRHLSREHVASLPSGVLVVRALPAAASSSSGDLARDLERCLQRALA